MATWISQQSRTYLKSDFEGKEYSIGNWLSQLNAGAELDYVSAYKKRPNDTHNYVVGEDASGLPEAGLSNLRCNGVDACVEGEQYAVGDITYGAGQANADIMNVGTYLEDILEYERLMLVWGCDTTITTLWKTMMWLIVRLVNSICSAVKKCF